MPADLQGGYRHNQAQQAAVDTDALSESHHYLFMHLAAIQHHIFIRITGSQSSNFSWKNFSVSWDWSSSCLTPVSPFLSAKLEPVSTLDWVKEWPWSSHSILELKMGALSSQEPKKKMSNSGFAIVDKLSYESSGF